MTKSDLAQQGEDDPDARVTLDRGGKGREGAWAPMTGAAGGGGPKSMHGNRATGTFCTPEDECEDFQVDNMSIF